MNKKIRIFVAGIASIITVTVISPALIFAVSKESEEPLKMVVMSDTHLFPEEFGGEEGPNFQAYLSGDRKMLMESERIIDAAIEKALEEKPDVVLIPGDLTKDSERLAHNMLAEKLKKLEDNGIEVFVINGNHDINNPDAIKFVPDPENPGNDIKVKVDTVKQDEFKEIYADFGYDQAIAKHEGSVSYVAQLKPGYRLISIDTGTYGENPSDQATGGYFRDGLIDWVLDQVRIAKEAGDEVIGMMHHGIVEHFDGQATIFAPYVVEGWEEASTKFADAGMQYVFTGHFHAQDVVSKTTEAGNKIFDIMTGSLVTSPSPIRTVEFDKNLDRFKMDSYAIESIEGIPNFQEYSSEFLKEGIPDMVVSLLQDILLGFFPEEETYSLNDALNKIGFTGANINIEERINKAREEGIYDQFKSLALEEGVNKEDIESYALITSAQIKNFIKAVTEELKTVTIPGTDNKKFMDAVQYCLIQVYNGDEVYSEEMKEIRNLIAAGDAVPELLTEIINKHKMKLGAVGLLLSKDLIRSLFNIEVSEGVTVGGTVSGALASLIDGLLTDKWPADNDFILYAGEIISAARVVDGINQLSETITLEDKSAIEYLRAMYNDLSESEKKLVSNYDKLVSAEKAIESLELGEADKLEANKVIDLINTLPETISLTDKEQINNIRAEYDKLTDVQKALVTNLDKLVTAEQAIEKLELEEADKIAAQKVIDLISNLPKTITLADKEQVKNIRAEYDKLTDSQKKLVTNLDKLVKAEKIIKDLENNNSNNNSDKNNGKLPQTGGTPAVAIGLFGTIMATIGGVMFKNKK